MYRCDLNCDMGEGAGNDEAIMPCISSANIACGYHAGDEETMRRTVLLAKKYGVAIGTHPSFLDRENFGRTEKTCTPEQVYQLVKEQIASLSRVAADCKAVVRHIKPHGALYNMAAKDEQLSKAIAQAVKDFDKYLVLFGLSGSHLIREAKYLGLLTASEVFADRSYQDDGSLTPRSQPHALIEEEQEAVRQVIKMIKQGTVTAVSGKEIPIVAETVCIHGDGKNAFVLAKKIRDALEKESITVCPPKRQ